VKRAHDRDIEHEACRLGSSARTGKLRPNASRSSPGPRAQQEFQRKSKLRMCGWRQPPACGVRVTGA
jgi:hypothetical protein